jgi:hypothetical protein
MSKYIPTENKPKSQVKPKLKIKVQFNGEEHILNEYDIASMVSDLNVKVMQLTQAVNGITTAMQAATDGIKTGTFETGSPYTTEPQVIPNIKLPNLKKVSSSLSTPENIYPNASDNVTLQS